MIKPLLIGCLLMLTSLSHADETSVLTVRLDTPHPGFSLRIEQVVLKDGVLHVLARVSPPANQGDMMFPMVITEIQDSVTIPAAAAPQKVYLLGRTWNWGDEEVQVIANEAAFGEQIQGGKALAITRP